MVTTMRL